jgi:hypothetical protein
LTAAGLARLQPVAFSWNRRLDQDVYFVRTDHHAGTGTEAIRVDTDSFRHVALRSAGHRSVRAR